MEANRQEIASTVALLLLLLLHLEAGKTGRAGRFNPTFDQVIRMPGKEDDDRGREGNGTRWAVLVAGSLGYGNYRHQADVCHAYQILKRGGLKDKNVIVMMYDDVGLGERRLTPGGSTGLANLSVTDCGGDDLDLKEEMGKQFVDLLSEEMKLRETVSKEHNHHINITFAEARRIASLYQKEAEKCNTATQTCEQAREQSEVLWNKEKKITSLWERRARQLGWEGE